MTFADDLVILAVGAKPRGGPDNGKLPWRFRYGMRGAVLVTLTLAGRVEVADGHIVMRDPSPLGDPALDEALAGLAAVRATPAAEWMADMRAALRTAVTGTGPVEFSMAALAGLVHAGDIAPLLYPGRENTSLRAKLAELAGQDLATTVPGTRPGTGSSDDPLMHAAAAAVQSAVHHSVHAAVSAATTASHHSGGSSSGGDSSSGHHHH